MRDEGASDHEIDVALAEAKLPSVVQVGCKSFDALAELVVVESS